MCLLVFDGSETQLLEFHNTTLDFPSIALIIFKGAEGQLHTTLYRKSTSRITILTADFFHPHHLKKNIPYQFQLLQHILHITEFVEQATAMPNRFSDSAYKPMVIKEAFKRAQSLQRLTLEKTKHQARTNKSVLCYCCNHL